MASPLIPDKTFIFFSSPQTWQNARTFCLGRGLVLATILSDTEYAAVFNAITASRYWIGLNDIATEGTFVWTDGSTSTYRNWAAGNPSDSNSNEDCVEIMDALNSGNPNGAWNDNTCSAQLGFLCARCPYGPCTQVCGIYRNVFQCHLYMQMHIHMLVYILRPWHQLCVFKNR